MQEGEAPGAYGEWVPVDKTADETAATFRKAVTAVPIVTPASSSADSAAAAGLPGAVEQPVFVSDSDSVFPDPPQQVRIVQFIMCVSYWVCNITNFEAANSALKPCLGS